MIAGDQTNKTRMNIYGSNTFLRPIRVIKGQLVHYAHSKWNRVGGTATGNQILKIMQSKLLLEVSIRKVCTVKLFKI